MKNKQQQHPIPLQVLVLYQFENYYNQMKKLIPCFLIILNYFSYSQTGYQKIFNSDLSNAILGSREYNNNLFLNHISYYWKKGYYSNIIICDTNVSFQNKILCTENEY